MAVTTLANPSLPSAALDVRATRVSGRRDGIGDAVENLQTKKSPVLRGDSIIRPSLSSSARARHVGVSRGGYLTSRHARIRDFMQTGWGQLFRKY